MKNQKFFAILRTLVRLGLILVFVILVKSFLHELGHFLVGLVLGLSPVFPITGLEWLLFEAHIVCRCPSSFHLFVVCLGGFLGLLAFFVGFKLALNSSLLKIVCWIFFFINFWYCVAESFFWAFGFPNSMLVVYVGAFFSPYLFWSRFSPLVENLVK